MHERTDGYGLVEGWVDGLMDGRTNVWMGIGGVMVDCRTNRSMDGDWWRDG